MSADIYVSAPGCCGPHSHNVTHNLGAMFRAAGVDWHDYEGEGGPASKMLPEVVLAWSRLTDDPEDYEHLNPENGWGDLAGARQVLKGLMRDLATHPDATVTVSL